jgi:hypothetical protein
LSYSPPSPIKHVVIPVKGSLAANEFKPFYKLGEREFLLFGKYTTNVDAKYSVYVAFRTVYSSDIITAIDYGYAGDVIMFDAGRAIYISNGVMQNGSNIIGNYGYYYFVIVVPPGVEVGLKADGSDETVDGTFELWLLSL